VAEVRLYHNGKLLRTVKNASGAKQASYTFNVELVPGENTIKATALNDDRVESNEDSILVVLDSPKPHKPVLHVLVVGINKYEDTRLNLNYARQDGMSLAHFFATHGNTLFASVDVTSLFDDDASWTNIKQAFDKLATLSRPEDVVVLYLAGHGVVLDEQFYFLPHEMHIVGDDVAATRKYGISAVALSEELRRIPALKQVLLLDACHSATALKILSKAAAVRALDAAEQKAAQMLARSVGVYLIAASMSEQQAFEVPELGHGVLTYAVLSGLGEQGGPKAAVSSDGMVTILSLLQYVNQEVPDLTEKYYHQKQYPVSFNTGMDFPLVMR
jgi:uncharacterized caspase-like protein